MEVLGKAISDDQITGIAKICHEVNKTYCESIGDFSQYAWEKAPEWQKQSAINGVKFHLSNPESKPCDSHNSWMKEKLDNGWVYGNIKDENKKTHPCILPYDNLPEDQKTKDKLFIAIVRAVF